jgi:ribosome biogenesis GTPase A
MVQQVSRKSVFPPDVAPYIDVAAYLLDARAPASTLWLDEMLVGKELILLTRADQAEPGVTKQWRSFFKRAGYPCIILSSTEGQGLEQIKDYLATLLEKKTKMAQRRGIHTASLRMVALGVPNVGKSTFLNVLIGTKRFKTGDRPGVTRGPQWVRLFEDVDVLDTAGILRDVEALRRRKPYWLLLNLMPYDSNDIDLREQAVALLLSKFNAAAWKRVARQYKIRDIDSLRDSDDNLALFEAIAAARGYKLTNYDQVERAHLRLINDFQAGKFGPVSLETPEDAQISSPLFRGGVTSDP